MDTQLYLDKMKSIQSKLLEYIDIDDNIEENFQKLIQAFDENKISTKKFELKSILHLICSVSSYHFRTPDFFQKIGNFLSSIKNSIKQSFSNYEIFNIFKRNKRILLLLIELDIITMNRDIAIIISTDKYKTEKYPQYFFPELKKLNINSLIPEIPSEFNDNEEKFEEKRKLGENDSYICEIIRKDMIEEFITYYNQNDLNNSSSINESIFETNLHFNKITNCSLMEYAAFFGSVQIFKYMFLNNANNTSNFEIFAIHGNNPELIHFLEDQSIEMNSYDYLNESIKCLHNEIADYIQCNIQQKEDDKVIHQCLKYYNFAYIQNESINKSSIFDFCKYDHYKFLEQILKNKNININQTVIHESSFINTIQK